MPADGLHNLGGHAAEQLLTYLSRIERLEGEIAELNDDKREVYAEAKACGFDKAILRKLVARRRKDRSELQEEDALLELYEAAVLAVAERPPAKCPLDD